MSEHVDRKVISMFMENRERSTTTEQAKQIERFFDDLSIAQLFFITHH